MRYFQHQIARLPITLNCLENGSVVFSVRQNFQAIIDPENDLIMDINGFTLRGAKFSYNTQYKYKLIPEILEWLQKEFN